MAFHNVLKVRSDEIRYLGLFLISLILVIWQYFGMSIRLDVLPDAMLKFKPFVHDDHINGGKSTSTLTLSENNIHLDCEIILSDTFAFCGVQIPIVAEVEKGMDLSRYDRVHIAVEYQADSSDTLLFYMLNRESDLQGSAYLKNNMWAVRVKNGKNSYKLSTDHFFVPSWWLYQNDRPGIKDQPDISNVIALQITTGDNSSARKVSFSIQNISFLGKWITADQLYAGLLVAWLILLSYHGLRNVRLLSNQFKKSNMENAKLMQLNSFLSIQKEQFETLAKYDKLTGALNRAGVRDVLRNIYFEYHHDEASYALLFLDLDHFKKINDECGHNAGDRVLKQLVKLISTETRDSDSVVRWGGEEFVLICPETSLKGAIKLAETLLNLIENGELLEGRKVTCSIGIALYRGEDIKEWFKRADDALYQAKKDGRNCMRIAD